MTDLSELLDLRRVPPALRKSTEQAFDAGDGGLFVIMAASQDRLGLVYDNIFLLEERGILESSLLTAFICTRTNHHRWRTADLDFMFGRADRDVIREAGDPLPENGPFRIFRGISGVNRYRRSDGYAWTASLDIACWFATRFSLPNPAVLVAEVFAGHVLAYVNERNEDEFVCKPNAFTVLAISASEIEHRAEQHAENLRRRHDERLRALKAG